MIDALVSGLAQVFSWPTFGLMLLGVVVGFWVGILPGLGGATALALMLPFIYDMTPVSAFAFLLGMISVTATTGDVTSVLFAVPGEGTAAATILDGHPLAKQGQAGRALGAVLFSSLVGSLFGALVLLLSIPIVRPLVLSFGSPELFVVTVLSLSFLGALGGKSVLKGLLMGGMGLMLSMIGMESQSAQTRYTFGLMYLWDGLSIVPVVVGLFGIPEIIDLAVQRTSIADVRFGKIAGVTEGIKDTFRHWGLTLRCSAIGAFFGILPGIGSGVGQWVVYAHARQTSPDKERFGKGAIEGVLGPGAANNSSMAAALIPTVGFGIPGGTAMAILLGAFHITGLVPGPAMLSKHLDVTFSMFWVVILANIITTSVSLIFVDQIAKITFVKGTILVPFLVLLISLGAFTTHNDLADIGVALIFGLIGTVMVWLDWPRPPLILGLILGSWAENYLYISVERYGASWLSKPFVIVGFALVLAVILSAVWEKRRLAGQNGAEVSGVKQKAEMLFCLCVLALFAFAVYEARQWALYAKLMPWVVGFPMLALGVAQLLIDFRPQGARTSAAQEIQVPALMFQRRMLTIAAWIVGFAVGIWLLGFLVTVPLFTFLYLKSESGEKVWFALLLSLLSWVVLVGFFDWALSLRFPAGQVFIWLGLG